MMYHFCLIEDSGAAKVSTLPTSSSIGSAVNSNQNQSEILNNLLHVFLSSSDAKALMASSMESSSSMESARKTMLSTLPRLASCASNLWSALDKAKDNKSCVLVGAPKAVRSRYLKNIFLFCLSHQSLLESSIDLYNIYKFYIGSSICFAFIHQRDGQL